MSNNLTFWLDNLASSPVEQDDGHWVDLDGVAPPYDPTVNYAKIYSQPNKPRTANQSKFANEIKEARDNAKKQGYAPLTGSTAQKQWAVQIRDERVKIVPVEYLDFITSDIFKHSKYWIETRNMNADAFVKQTKRLYEMHDKYWELFEKFESKIPADVKPGGTFQMTEEQKKINHELEDIKEAINSIIQPPVSKYKQNPHKRKFA